MGGGVGGGVGSLGSGGKPPIIFCTGKDNVKNKHIASIIAGLWFLVYQNLIRNSLGTTLKLLIDLYSTLQVETATTSVWMIQFQRFKHHLVANNELFHMVCAMQILFSTGNLHGY